MAPWFDYRIAAWSLSMFKFLRWSSLATLLVLLAMGAASAQEAAVFQATPGDLSKLPPEVRARVEAQMRAAQAGQPQPGQQPGAKPEEKKEEKKPEEGKKPEDEVKTIKRPTEPPKANSDELKARPDKDGMVQFSFSGQPWTEVLEWYAEVADCSLDWQELPADFLNLTTQRRYTIAETRDLLNGRLLARGFTLIKQGDVLTVVKLDKVDPSLVPRIEPDDLEEHLPHDFGRVRFDLPRDLDPKQAVDDVKILLNPSAKVTPLLASKQIMVIDAVANLRDVRDLLYSQQLAESSDLRPRQFPIRYRRADYVADQIMIALGLDPAARKSPQELQIEQQRMQLFMQMQQKGTDISKMLKQDGPQVFIAVDRHRNSISVNAPPKEMAMVARVIEQFDVPQNGQAAAPSSTGELSLEKYQTITVSPDAVVTALKEIGNLHPLTQLQTDSRSKTIFATATPEDHATIQRMLDKLDGSGRRLRPVWLNRRMRADQVAGTIVALMVGEKKDEDRNRRPFFFYDPWDRGGEEEESDSTFRVQADVENNRLLLWANDAEYAEVTQLLRELGAIASGNGKNPNTFRVLDTGDSQNTAELLERLQQAWGGQNKLNINVAPQAKPPVDETPAEDKPAESEDKLTLRRNATFGKVRVQLAQYVEEPAAAESAPAAGAPAAEQPAPSAEAPPINVTVTPDGRIVISSNDVAALDQLEELLIELQPKSEDFAVFKLRNARAVDVHYNLKEYFADELADEGNDPFLDWYFDYDTRGMGEQQTLGKRPKLRFIWDPDSNTIVAQNASPAQLETIKKLIEIYDQPVGEVTRKTEIVPIVYSKAQDVATALKEVYRDLLSSKDKEFQNQRDGDRRGRTETYYRFFGGSGSSDNKKAPVKLAFEGALSVGVDTVSNALIISAEEEIFNNVKALITQLDERAKPNTVVQVYEVQGLSAPELQKALATALSSPWPGGKPENAQANQNGRGGGDGDRDRWRRWRERRDRDDND
jgi:type II secretory pathway component GspD/PulD (secretin)